MLALVSGIAIFAVALKIIHETHHHRSTGPFINPLRSYAALLSQPRFTAFVLQSGFQSGAFYAMAAASPLLMKEYLGRSASEYGVYFLSLPIGYCLGNWISSRLSGRIAVETMVLAGSLMFVATVITQAAFVLFTPLTAMTIFVPGFLISVAQGLSLPNAQAGAIRVAPTLAGTAAGLGVFLQLFCGASFSQIYGLLADGTPYPMIWTVSASTLLALIAGLYVYATRERSAK